MALSHHFSFQNTVKGAYGKALTAETFTRSKEGRCHLFQIVKRTIKRILNKAAKTLLRFAQTSNASCCGGRNKQADNVRFLRKNLGRSC